MFSDIYVELSIERICPMYTMTEIKAVSLLSPPPSHTCTDVPAGQYLDLHIDSPYHSRSNTLNGSHKPATADSTPHTISQTCSHLNSQIEYIELQAS